MTYAPKRPAEGKSGGVHSFDYHCRWEGKKREKKERGLHVCGILILPRDGKGRDRGFRSLEYGLARSGNDKKKRGREKGGST